MKSMLQTKYMIWNRNNNVIFRGVCMNKLNIDFIVDVAFESLDPDVAALVKDRVSTEETVLVVDRSMTAHTVAGYAFIDPYLVALFIRRDCGPSMSLDVAEMICSIPSLKEVSLYGAFHPCFFATLARKGKESKVKSLQLHVEGPAPASSHHLSEALCSMPNLTDLTLQGSLNEEFCSTLKANALSIQVKTLQLHYVKCPTPASSHHLVEALCSMPNLTDLTLGMDLDKESNEVFYSSLKANASSIQVKTFRLYDVGFCTPASLQLLAEALCSMPNLSDLTLFEMGVNEELCSALKAKASSIQGCFPQIRNGNFRFNGVAQADLNSFLHTLSRLYGSDYFRRTLPPSDHPQHQPMGEIHSPRRTLPPSDHPQQHVGNTSDAVCQFSQTHREGNSSQSRPYKRQAPSTQSRVPQDDPEIPEKQSKV